MKSGLILLIICLVLVAGLIFVKQNKEDKKVIVPQPTAQPTALPSYSPTSTVVPGCENLSEEEPRINRLSKYIVKKGETVTVYGCNLSGFEGDLDVVLEKQDGVKIMLTAETLSGDRFRIPIKITEPCQKGEMVVGRYSGIKSECKFVEITPGEYKVYVEPWGNKSNEVRLTVQ